MSAQFSCQTTKEATPAAVRVLGYDQVEPQQLQVVEAFVSGSDVSLVARPLLRSAGKGSFTSAAEEGSGHETTLYNLTPEEVGSVVSSVM